MIHKKKERERYSEKQKEKNKEKQEEKDEILLENKEGESCKKR